MSSLSYTVSGTTQLALNPEITVAISVISAPLAVTNFCAN